MDTHVREVMRLCSDQSDAERITFPEVVAKLMAAGVERYHADMVRAEKTYFLADGQSEVTPTKRLAMMPAAAFDAAGVAAAVRAVQAGAIAYGEFCRRIMLAGCTDYLVSLAGRRVIYRGRTGDSHIEWFPAAK